MSSSKQTSALVQANSYHPKLTTDLEIPDIHPCSLHLHYALPPLLFVDPYELANYRASYTFQHRGPSNLELPLAALNKSGSSLLLDILVPRHGGSVEVEVPLHVRYGTTSANRSLEFQMTELQTPSSFLSCPKSPSHQSTPSATLPPEFEQLFDLDLYDIVTIPSNGAGPLGIIRTPVGSREDLASVEIGTALVFALSFCYLLNVVLRTIGRIGSQ
ncbi:PIG-X [Mycena epipterygia]|nr:PIG-X [Mycena epipterygia]